MRTSLARFPFLKSLDSFDYTYQPSLDKKLLKTLASCHFIEHGENVVILGTPGVGKTHLAVGPGLKTIEQGYRVLFTTAATMIATLTRAVIPPFLALARSGARRPSPVSVSATHCTSANPRLEQVEDVVSNADTAVDSVTPIHMNSKHQPFVLRINREYWTPALPSFSIQPILQYARPNVRNSAGVEPLRSDSLVCWVASGIYDQIVQLRVQP